MLFAGNITKKASFPATKILSTQLCTGSWLTSRSKRKKLTLRTFWSMLMSQMSLCRSKVRSSSAQISKLASFICWCRADVKETHQVYIKLKQQFTVFHKAVEKLRKSEKQPGELKHEITQLEEERAQLKDKIKSLKAKTSDLVYNA